MLAFKRIIVCIVRLQIFVAVEFVTKHVINDCNDQNTETEIIKGFLDSCANGNVHGRVNYE